MIQFVSNAVVVRLLKYLFGEKFLTGLKNGFRKKKQK